MAERKNNWWGKTLTNMDHYIEEIQLWKLGMRVPLDQFKRAEGLPEKSHKLMNLVKESFALLPYTISHIWVGLVILRFVIISLFVGWLFWYVATYEQLPWPLEDFVVLDTVRDINQPVPYYESVPTELLPQK